MDALLWAADSEQVNDIRRNLRYFRMHKPTLSFWDPGNHLQQNLYKIKTREGAGTPWTFSQIILTKWSLGSSGAHAGPHALEKPH